MHVCVRACMHAWWQKVLILHIFNQLFLQVSASLGCQTLCSLGACWVLPRHGQLVPMLWQVRAWGTSKGPRFRAGFVPNAASYSCHDFSNLLTTTQASGISGNATTHFREINRRHSPWVYMGSHIGCDCGCGHFLGGRGAGVVGVVSIVQLFSAKMETRSEGF